MSPNPVFLTVLTRLALFLPLSFPCMKSASGVLYLF